MELYGICRIWKFRSRKKMTGLDGGSWLAGVESNFVGGTVFSVQTHMDTYGPPWGHFPISPQFSDFRPRPVSWKVSVVARGEQAVPIEQKRHGQISTKYRQNIVRYCQKLQMLQISSMSRCHIGFLRFCQISLACVGFRSQNTVRCRWTLCQNSMYVVGMLSGKHRYPN